MKNRVRFIPWAVCLGLLLALLGGLWIFPGITVRAEALTAVPTETAVAVSPSSPPTSPTDISVPFATPTPTEGVTILPTPTFTPYPTSFPQPTATGTLTLIPGLMDPSITPVNDPTVTSTRTVILSNSFLTFAPNSLTVTNGTLFSVNLTAFVDVPVRSIQAGISYNPSVLSCSSIQEGTFLSSYANAHGVFTLFFPSSPVIHNNTGKIDLFSVTIMSGSECTSCAPGHDGGAAGNGTVIKLTCRAVGTGESYLNIVGAKLFDDSYESFMIQSMAVPGKVIVADPLAMPTATPTQMDCLFADVDRNGIVDGGDVVQIGRHWRETGVPGWRLEDIAQDGVVDASDVAFVSKCWLKTVVAPTTTPLPAATHTANPPTPEFTVVPTMHLTVTPTP